MIFAYFILFVAISIASVAAFYSIAGLITIFPSSVLAIILMGVVLEVGKLATTAWLHLNWKIAPKALKYYLTSAVIVLMFITSMGIFGYLSKAHIDQGVGFSTASVQISQIDSSVQRELRKIERAESTIQTLDDALAKYTELGAVSKGLAAREEQKEERQQLDTIITDANNKINELYEKKSELELEVADFQAEVGPIAFVAELLYGESDKEILESAVRVVILCIVFVFDPLAVLLIIAANVSLREGKRIVKEENKTKRGRPLGSKNKKGLQGLKSKIDGQITLDKSQIHEIK